MNRETTLWMAVIVFGVLLLGVRYVASDGGFGKAYVEGTPHRYVNIGSATDEEWVNYDKPEVLDTTLATTAFDQIPDAQKSEWTTFAQSTQRAYAEAQAADATQTSFRLSVGRTFGIWIAAFFTLAIFSFLIRDNPLYKIAEAVVVGVSAAYWMVVGFWDMIVPNLMAKLAPDVVRAWSMPDLQGGFEWTYLFPLILGGMLLMRLSPVGSWVSRWPLAFIVGTTAGIRLVGFIHADFLSQIRNSILPVVVTSDTGFEFWDSLKNCLIILGIFTCLVYFFFSIEHKGVVGQTARVGIWFLMITFGAAFGYTVMGRIALLAIRLEFLFDDWLWLIDPTARRVGDVVTMVGPGLQAIGLG